MNIIEAEALELLEFHKIKKYIADLCYCQASKNKASQLSVFEDSDELKTELYRVSELHQLIISNAYFPDIQFEDFKKEVSLLSLDGSMLSEEQFLLIKLATEISNTVIRFLKSKKTTLPYLVQLVDDLEDNKLIIDEIDRIVDFDGTVKNSASKAFTGRANENGNHRLIDS